MKDTFDKVLMDENTKEEIRNMLAKKRTSRPVWIKAVAGIAAAVIIVMAIPYTRKAVVRAAGQIISSISGNKKVTVTTSIDPYAKTEEIQIHFSGETADSNVKTKDGRLYLVIDNTWTDITDKCSEDEYFRYELPGDPDIKDVLYVGGTPDSYGWIEFIFTGSGNTEGGCIISGGKYDAKDTSHEWQKKAFLNEGQSLKEYDSSLKVSIG